MTACFCMIRYFVYVDTFGGFEIKRKRGNNVNVFLLYFTLFNAFPTVQL